MKMYVILLAILLCPGSVFARDPCDTGYGCPSRRWVEQENRDVTRDLILWHLLRQRNHADRLERLERDKLDRPIRRW